MLCERLWAPKRRAVDDSARETDEEGQKAYEESSFDNWRKILPVESTQHHPCKSWVLCTYSMSYSPGFGETKLVIFCLQRRLFFSLTKKHQDSCRKRLALIGSDNRSRLHISTGGSWLPLFPKEPLAARESGPRPIVSFGDHVSALTACAIQTTHSDFSMTSHLVALQGGSILASCHILS